MAAPTGSLIYAVPDDLIQTILQDLSASDLCHVASCCHWLREATNQDSLWLPLCRSRGWEHYGSTTDLAKIAPYDPFGSPSVTFQNDRIVTDDNTADLTSTCRWKGVYMRAYHLDRNWATNCCHFNQFYYDVEDSPPNIHTFNRFVDGDLLAIFKERPAKAIHVYDIRKETLQCVIPCVGMQGGEEDISFRDGVILVPFSDGKVYAIDAVTGQTLQTIEGNVGTEHTIMYFDGDLVITYSNRPYFERYFDWEKTWGIYVWCVKDGKLQRILTDGINKFYNVDYKDKMVAAVYDDDHIRMWDARSGECLHKLECQGPAEDLKVELGHNIIVVFSKKGDMFVAIIWSQDTGECQGVIHLPLARFNVYAEQVVGKLILIEMIHKVEGFGPNINSLHAYNFRGELVSATVASVCNEPYSFMKYGSKRPLKMWLEPQEGQYRCKPHRAVFNATPDGLVRLFDVQAPVIWIDEISMILYDHEEGRLRFRHYW